MGRSSGCIRCTRCTRCSASVLSALGALGALQVHSVRCKCIRCAASAVGALGALQVYSVHSVRCQCTRCTRYTRCFLDARALKTLQKYAKTSVLGRLYGEKRVNFRGFDGRHGKKNTVKSCRRKFRNETSDNMDR